MNPRTAAQTALGVAGTYLVALSIPQAVGIIGMGLLDRNSEPLIGSVAIIAPVMTAFVGSGLIVLRRSLSARLAPEAQEQVPALGVAGMQAAAISVIGVYFLASGTSGLLREVFRALAPNSVHGAALSIDACAGPMSEVAIGLALFLGARGVVNVWRLARGAGRHDRWPKQDVPNV